MKDPAPISLKSVAMFQSSWWEAFGAALQDFLEEAGRTLRPRLVGPRIKTTTSRPALMQTQPASTGVGGKSPNFFPNFFFKQDSCVVFEYFIDMSITFPRNFRLLYFYFLVCFARG